jgi:peptide/nickel transport system substrate-binding protein
VDIETLKTKLMNGLAQPTGSLMPSMLAQYGDSRFETRLPFDLAQARALMAQAGYAEGFEVTLDCPNNRYVNDERLCLALASMWARINVKVRVNAMPRTTYFPKLEKLDTSLYLLGWGGPLTDPESIFTPIYRSRGAVGVGSFNYGNYKDDALDALAAASSREADPVKRAALIKQVFLRHNEQVHHIPLHRQVIPWAVRSGVSVVHRADNWLEVSWITMK